MLRMRRSAGLTLVELLVVLTILVILATAAVTSMEGVLDQTRFDASRQSLAAVEEAVLGPPGQRNPDGTPAASGFVADIGRLPVSTADPDPARELQELWLQGALPPFSIQHPAGDPDVQLPGGWRGPYLRLPLGAQALRNAWGHPFLLLRADGTAAAAGESVSILGSLGADNAAGGSSYDADIDVVFHRTVAPIQSPRHVGDVPFRITPSVDPGAGAHVVVRLYAPVDGVVRTAAQLVFTAAAGVQGGSFPGVSTGPRVLRAYQTDTLPATPDDPVPAPTDRSPVTSRVVPPGGLPEVPLILE